ncbi:hypothetical protein HD806DRAFT_455140 [Xylariaceae sp. AK1471]|nr:hypothetical protein HD806DRAFT_455140 [Xylariaceae sp. AK1471]
MKFIFAILTITGGALAGCSDGGRDAPPAVATFACATDHKSPAAIDVKNKYIPYLQNLAGQNCGTSGGCCTDLYKNAKMCGAAGGEDCAVVATALRTIVDECTDPATGLAGGNYWANGLNSGTWVSL